jgi:preprotein translocase SecF subunit
MTTKKPIWPFIRLVPKQTNFGFVRFARMAASSSVFLVFLTFVAFATGGLRQNPINEFNEASGGFSQKMGAVFDEAFNLGIDFKGGVSIEAVAPSAIDMAKVRSALHGTPGLRDPQVQGFDKPNQIMVRFLSENHNNEQAIQTVKSELTKVLPGVQFSPPNVVGSKVSSELYRNGIAALVAAMAMMLVYVWFRFELQMGVGSVVALLHDVILVLGFLSVTRLEFSLTSIAAILTIIGYSMNDTVVVYDRLRENMRKWKSRPLSELIDLSTNETLSRTIITGMTTLLALFGLTVVGGTTIQSFTIAMIFGVFIGTYSSIYVAAPFSLLVPRGGKAQKLQKMDDDRP